MIQSLIVDQVHGLTKIVLKQRGAHEEPCSLKQRFDQVEALEKIPYDGSWILENDSL